MRPQINDMGLKDLLKLMLPRCIRIIRLEHSAWTETTRLGHPEILLPCGLCGTKSYTRERIRYMMALLKDWDSQMIP